MTEALTRLHSDSTPRTPPSNWRLIQRLQPLPLALETRTGRIVIGSWTTWHPGCKFALNSAPGWAKRFGDCSTTNGCEFPPPSASALSSSSGFIFFALSRVENAAQTALAFQTLGAGDAGKAFVGVPSFPGVGDGTCKVSVTSTDWLPLWRWHLRL